MQNLIKLEEYKTVKGISSPVAASLVLAVLISALSAAQVFGFIHTWHHNAPFHCSSAAFAQAIATDV